MRPRNGFALAEVVVAIALLTVGVLALAASGTRLISFGQSSMRRLTAVARIRAVSDSLGAAPCRLLVSGSDSTLGVLVTWNVRPGAVSRAFLVTAQFADPAVHQLQLEGALPCD